MGLEASEGSQISSLYSFILKKLFHIHPPLQTSQLLQSLTGLVDAHDRSTLYNLDPFYSVISSPEVIQ